MKAKATEKTSEKKLTLSDKIFGCEFNEPLIHQVVISYLSAARAGTKAQKTRSEVSGGGRKPWRQKGTGRARAGTIRSPLWRGGGQIFAAKPRDYAQKVNKKMYRGAICSILSELLRQKRLKIFEEFKIASNKTAELVKLLKQLDLTNVLIITNEVDQNLYLAGRNIPYVDIRDIQNIDPLALIKADQVIITVDAIRQLEDKLG
ncbi:MAG: 50S ribosomal protein L4 [Gammaproteobacteria bacterium]|nr:50S ribosomal protein L4 [Gammaproteobacteria bacterium]